jgi:hypothetical protein
MLAVLAVNYKTHCRTKIKTKMKNCPICGKEVDAYHEVTFKEPYIHNIPFDGLMIYGAYSAPKETICFENNFLHFAFYDADGNLTDHRLIQLAVENPSTKSPSEEYMEIPPGEDDEDCEWNDFENDDWEDVPEFDYDQHDQDNDPNDSRNL